MITPVPARPPHAASVVARGALVRALLCAAAAGAVLAIVRDAAPASAIARWVPLLLGIALAAATVRHLVTWWRLR